MPLTPRDFLLASAEDARGYTDPRQTAVGHTESICVLSARVRYHLHTHEKVLLRIVLKVMPSQLTPIGSSLPQLQLCRGSSPARLGTVARPVARAEDLLTVQ